MRRRWRGRDLTPKDQVANALDSAVDLTPASEAPAALVKARWSALLPGQEIPLIGEDRYAIDTEEERREYH